MLAWQVVLFLVSVLVLMAVFLPSRKRPSEPFIGGDENADFDILLDGFEKKTVHQVDGVIGRAKVVKPKVVEPKAVEPKVVKSETASIPSEAEEILAFTIISKNPLGFSGQHLIESVALNDLHYGVNSMYHCYKPSAGHFQKSPLQKKILYSLASVVAPGTFDRDTLPTDRIPGVVLFMRIKKHSPDFIMAFEDMIRVAYDMADLLSAHVCDIQKKPLSEQMLNQYRKRVHEVVA